MEVSAQASPCPERLWSDADCPFRVRLRLYSERLIVEQADGKFREQEVAVLSLRFDYDGRLVRPRRSDDWLEADSDDDVERDDAAECRAQALVERHGAVELECVDGLITSYDSEADYVINVDENVHAICSFSGPAVEELRALGWDVQTDADFKFQVVPGGDRWVAEVSDADDTGNWFQLELGVEIDGTRVDLVPALLRLLEEAPQGGRLSALSRHVARCRALPVGDGRYVAIPWERLEPILDVLSELYDGESKPKFDLLDCLVAALARLEDAVLEGGSEIEWRGRVDKVERGRKLSAGPHFAPKPAALRAELRPYQHDGLTWLCHLRDHGVGGVLADDMGLGKTLQTIALLSIEKEARRMDVPTLIVVPTSLVHGWKQQIRQFAPHLRVMVLHGKKRHSAWERTDKADVVLTTYSVLWRDLKRFQEAEWHYVVLDEAQAIKNARSQASRAARSLRARHRLALTGTPVENNLDELWSLFDFVLPGLLGSAQRFRTGFRYPIEREGNESRLLALRNRVSPFVMRRLKENVARDLPPKTELVRHVDLHGEQRDLYESIRVAAHSDVRSAIRKQGFEASSVMILDALTKLRQVCCDPRLVPVDAARGVTASAKSDAFFAMVQSELGRGRRILVFSQFARMLGLLSAGLEEREIRHVTLTGASTERHRLVDAFQGGEADVFLISLKAGGTGLNLTRADTVIHYDPWWNAAAQMQATDRAHRIGQKNPVFVHNLVALGSVEERMLALQQKKRALADTLLGDEVGKLRLLPDDIDDLFAPLDDVD